MLTLRLARTGRKNLPNYRLVAADSRRAATSKFVARLGHYNPRTKELVIDKDEVQRFLDNGAQPSSKVVKLLSREKDVKLPKWAEKNLVIKPERKKAPTSDEVEVRGSDSAKADVGKTSGDESSETSVKEEAPAEAEEAKDEDTTKTKDEESAKEPEPKPDTAEEAVAGKEEKPKEASEAQSSTDEAENESGTAKPKEESSETKEDKK